MRILPILLVLTATVFAASAQAQTPVTPPPIAPAPTVGWSTSITETYVSTYVFRGLRLGGASSQPALNAAYGPWTFGVWGSTPISNTSKIEGQSDPEIDPSASYTATINDSLNVQPGFTWYTYPRAPLNQGFYRSTFEPNLAVNWTVIGLTLTPKIYYDVVLKGATYEMNVGYTVPLKQIDTEIDFTATAGRYLLDDSVNSVPATRAWGSYGSIGVSSPFTLTNHAKLVLGWSYNDGLDAYTKQGKAKEQLSPTVACAVATTSLVWTF